VTSWTALLESLHSALVDELNEQFKKIKPELGLPLRQAKFAIPHQEVAWLCHSEIFFGDVKGVAFLALSVQAHQDDDLIWNGMIRRAGAEFGRRQIQPRLHPMKKNAVTNGAIFISNLPEMKRVIWIPFRLGDRAFYLGLGVSSV